MFDLLGYYSNPNPKIKKPAALDKISGLANNADSKSKTWRVEK
jgi:hypothetical protein